MLPNDADMLAEKMVYLHQHREKREAMVERAYKRVGRVYSSQLMAENYSRVYSGMV